MHVWIYGLIFITNFMIDLLLLLPPLQNVLKREELCVTCPSLIYPHIAWHVHCPYTTPGECLWILELRSHQIQKPNPHLCQEIAVDFGLLAGLVGKEVVLPLCENLCVLNAVHPHAFLRVCATCSSRVAY